MIRLFRPDIIVQFADIVAIEESSFRYRGASPSSSVYKGHFLTIKTNSNVFKTSTLNEPNFVLLRDQLKMEFGSKVKLSEQFHPDTVNWLLLSFILGPISFLLVVIIEKLYPLAFG